MSDGGESRKRTPTGEGIYVIAEIGSNHACDLNVALESIDTAAETGADAVKFQSIALEELYHQPSDEVRKLHEKIDLPEAWYPKLKQRCDERGVDFLSSPTYLRAVDLLEKAGVMAYKIASAQAAVFPQLVAKVARLGKPVILSTGLVTIDELDRVVAIFRDAGNLDGLVVLHCNSVYPAPPAIVHLPRMLDYAERYGCGVGFSDHTESDVASSAAVAMGAKVIERHFTLSRDLDSPDAPFALEPDRFGQFVRAVREAEIICSGDPRNYLEPDEASFRSRIGHRLMATCDIEPGEALDDSNTRWLRGNARDGAIDAWIGFGLEKKLIAKAPIQSGEWIRYEGVE